MNANILLLTIGIFVLPASIHAQTLFGIGGSGQDYGKDICQTSDGSIIATGYFQGTVDFDPSTAKADRTARGNPASPGAIDMYLARYTPNGELLWVQVLGGEGADMPHTVQVDAAGNIYLTGYTSGGADLGSGSGEWRTPARPGRDAFVAVYSPEGKLRWAVAFGNPETPPLDPMDTRFEDGNDITTDRAGNVYTIGVFDDTVIVDSASRSGATSSLSSQSGSRDIFVTIHDPNGNLTRAWSIGGSGQDGGHGIRVDQEGNIIIGGFYSNSMRLSDSVTLTSQGGFDAFIAVYTSAGHLKWARSLGGPQGDMIRPGALEIDDQGNIFAAGDLAGTFSLPNGTVFRSRGMGDLFASKWSPSGELIWLNSVGGPQLDAAHRIDLDAAGNVYVAGWSAFTGPVGRVNLQRIASGPVSDIFLGKLDPTGNWVGAMNYGGKTAGRGESQIAAGLDVMPGGRVALTGRFHSSALFEKPFGRALSSAGGADSFIAVFGQP